MARVANSEAERLHDERREQIKRAALQVFANQGISRTKMSMIADEAGISQGLSYRYFKSKEDLFTIHIQEALETAEDAIASVSQLPGTPYEQIRAFTLNMIDESHRPVFMLLQQARASDDVPDQARLLIHEHTSNNTMEQLIPVICKGQQEGLFCEGDPRRLLFLYFSVITGLML